MTIRRVKAERGSAWLIQGVRLFGRRPAALAGMGALVALINWFPVLGGVAIAVFGPTLFAGLMLAAREAQAGRRVEIGQLFAGFRMRGRLPKLVALCLPTLAAGFVASWLFVDLFGAETVQAIATGAKRLTDVSPLPGKSAGLVLAGMALAFSLAWLAVFFAIPQVMFRDFSPWLAMAQSLLAAFANLGAMLVYVVALVVFALLAVLAFSIVGFVLSALGEWIAWLSSIAVVAALLPITLAANLQAWQDVFGDVDATPDAGEEASAEL